MLEVGESPVVWEEDDESNERDDEPTPRYVTCKRKKYDDRTPNCEMVDYMYTMLCSSN